MEPEELRKTSLLRPSILDRLPPELWTEILDIACRDLDGSTARALSSTSKTLRFLAHNHLYYTIKVTSGDQLIKLDHQLANDDTRAALGTRFMSITLPQELLHEAYPAHTWCDDDTGSSYGEDTQSVEDEVEEIDDEFGGNISEDSSDAYEYASLDGSEVMDLEQEILDNDMDLQSNPVTAIKMSCLSELENSTSSLNKVQRQLYGAIRRLLERSADTLEVFSLFHRPRQYLIPHDIHFPPLPRVRHLSLGMPLGYKLGRIIREPPIADYTEVPLHYPSVRVLRLLGKELNFEWWKTILQSVPDSEDVKVITGLPLYRQLGYCNKQIGRHKWEFLSRHVYQDDLYKVLDAFWMDDVNGGDGTIVEFLDEKHGHGYQYEPDDDL